MKKPEFRQEILNCMEVLREGGLILYPTDTVWGIGCDATKPEAVEKVYELKKRKASTPMICLVGSDFMLEEYITTVPDLAYDIMDLSDKPTTIIYDKPRGLATNLLGADNTLGVRVARNGFCKQLIKAYRKPLVATSANLSGETTPSCFDEISPAISKGVDYVVNLGREVKDSSPSAIIRLGVDGTVAVIRK